MFCRIPCAKGWSELQENIRGRGGRQWIIRTGHVGAGALTRAAMRNIARRARTGLARREQRSPASIRTGISDGLCLTDANARTRTSVPEYGATVTGVSFRFMKVSSSDDSL